MKFLRLFGRGILILIISAAIGLSIGLATLQATIFNKNEVKSWLEKSGVYNNLVDSLVRPETGKGGGAEVIIDAETLKKAINDTFPPIYVKQQIEDIIDNTYAWLGGQTPSLVFSINIPEKRQEFAKNLAIALEPKVAQLPTCTSRFNESTQCIPPGMNSSQFAKQLADRAQEGTAMLEQPITEKSVTQQAQPQQFPLPQLYQSAPSIIMGAAVVALLGTIAYVFLSDSRLRGTIIVARRITLGTAATFLLGLIVWYLGSSMQLATTLAPTDAQQAHILNKLIDPLLQQALPAIGGWMMLIAGGVITLAGSAWIGAYLLWRKQQQILPTTPADQPGTPTPPSTPLP